ncbi:MAG: membrane protein insertion efficiency factor YidD [Nitrospinae bacterium]|nr:membrane protein insertion efficiency factor YidD [Nitrospinota bacterium]
MIKYLLLILIKSYQGFVSPFFSPVCRFYPSCSEYAVQAIERYNLWKGLYLTLLRILKCHSFHKGGFDPLK